MVMIGESSRGGGFARAFSRKTRAAFPIVASLSACAGAAALFACSRTGLWLEDLPPSNVNPLAMDADTLEQDAGTPDSSLADASVTPGLVLFGGQGPNGSLPLDTWVWISGKWTQTNATGPVGRYNHSMISWKGTTLLYGGLADAFAYNQFTETWQWDGTSWHQLSSIGPESNDSPIALAELNGTVVAYVLNTGPGASTWVWDGSSWTLRNTEGPPRSPQAVMGTIGNQVIWVGSGQTWSWDGSNWTQLAAPGPVGNPKDAPSYIATLASSLVCLIPPPNVATFNGNVFAGTAVWDGTSWNALNVPGPSARENPAMSGMPDQAILFGGAVPGVQSPEPLRRHVVVGRRKLDGARRLGSVGAIRRRDG